MSSLKKNWLWKKSQDFWIKRERLWLETGGYISGTRVDIRKALRNL